MSADVILSLVDVTRRYGDEVAVDRVSLDVHRGEFITLLGPSGCGKTTILRMVAGFVTPSSGDLVINGRRMNDVPAYEREIGLVFQNLALFPHLNAFDNIAFGLSLKKLPREQIRSRVDEALELVGLRGLGQRHIGQLSGGQRQRVALARSLVVRPSLLLLDEPLSALDLKLRRQLQVELKRIQKQTGTTFIFVTHDQEEALTMSDRIAVMNRGLVEQFTPAFATYRYPRTAVVAGCVGESNLLEATVVARDDGSVTVQHAETPATLRYRLLPPLTARVGERVAVSIRPEAMRTGAALAATDCRLRGEVLRVDHAGPLVTTTLSVDGRPFAVRHAGHDSQSPGARAGERLDFGWHPDDAVVVSLPRSPGT